jgi:hypothetical protein
MKYLQSGINYYNVTNLRSATLCGHTTAVDMPFELKKHRPPIDINHNNYMAGVIINNIIKEENIAVQRWPLDNTIFAEYSNWLAAQTTRTQIRTFLPT